MPCKAKAGVEEHVRAGTGDATSRKDDKGVGAEP